MATPENLLISGILKHKRKDVLIKGSFSSDNITRYQDELMFIMESRTMPSLEVFKSRFPTFKIRPVPETDLIQLIKMCKSNKVKNDLTESLRKAVNDLDNGIRPDKISSALEIKTRQINSQFSSVVNVDPLNNSDLFIERYKDKRKKYKSGKSLGTPYGMPTMDKLTGGMHPGELIAFCSRTGVGKTYVMCKLAASALMQNKTPEFFSLEMNWDEIWARILTILTFELNQKKATGMILRNTDLNLGKISTKKLQRIIDEIKKEIKAKVLIPDIKGKFSIEAAGRRIEQDKPDLAIFDYFGLADNESGKIENWMQAAEASHSAKAIARIYEIPFVLGAQLNRGGAQDPSLTNIGITDSIGQDSDKVFILTERGSSRNRIQIKCEKFRNGRDKWRIVVDWNVNRGKIKEIRHYMDDDNGRQ